MRRALTDSGLLFFAKNTDDDEPPQSRSTEFTQILSSGSATHYMVFSNSTLNDGAEKATLSARIPATAAIHAACDSNEKEDAILLAANAANGVEGKNSSSSSNSSGGDSNTDVGTAIYSSSSGFLDRCEEGSGVGKGGVRPPTLLKLAGMPSLSEAERDVRAQARAKTNSVSPSLCCFPLFNPRT